MDINKLREDIVFSETLRGQRLTFHSRWGLFSPRAVDEGTRLLLDHVEVAEGDRCLDVGCGYGAIGLVLARLAPRGETWLVDRDFVAVEYARANAERNAIANCHVQLSDGFGQLPPELRFDVVASNLPAKAGNEAYAILFADAFERLAPGGRLYVVTLSNLRRYIERAFTESFGNYRKVKQGRAHTVSLAVKEPAEG
jgi:16S rRNA G1207 methylase RsmC